MEERQEERLGVLVSRSSVWSCLFCMYTGEMTREQGSVWLSACLLSLVRTDAVVGADGERKTSRVLSSRGERSFYQSINPSRVCLLCLLWFPNP